MTCVSSFRPLGESPEIAKNQLFAKQSWEQTFDRIIYFGDYEEKLAALTGHDFTPVGAGTSDDD